MERVSCARIPAGALASLAGLRRHERVSVAVEGGHAWVFWVAGDERVLREVLPAAGVELFEREGGVWRRAGRRLPCSEAVPSGEAIPLAAAVTPEAFSAELPAGEPPRPIRLGLARDDRPRPTTAALCPLAELGRWADSATSADLAAIRGAVSGDSALLVGRPLPPWSGAVRYWGRQLLVPIGHEPRPSLPEPVLFEALGGSEGVLLRLVPGPGGPAVESIPTSAFRPLTRAGVRLALAGARSS